MNNASQIAAESTSLKGFIDYQSGAVVSKEVVRAHSGTVTFFAFDQQQGLSEHTAPFDVLVVVTEGEAEITISGKTHKVRENEMIRMPACEPHALYAAQRFKMLLIMLKNSSEKK
ncbi:MAG: cupin domain-containing protein [Alphaproteobacteria bacterium]|nr:cupin domain-containing protein [Alphaproteobacteria bacterium]